MIIGFTKQLIPSYSSTTPFEAHQPIEYTLIEKYNPTPATSLRLAVVEAHVKRTRETETRSDARATAVALKVQPAHGRAVDRMIASRSGSLGKFPQNLRTTINHFLASIRGNADKAKRIHIRGTQTRIIKKTKIDSQDSIEFRHFPAVWTRDVET